MVTVAVRIPEELAERVNALGKPRIVKSDVLRRALEAGLKVLENERGEEEKSETPQATEV